MRYTSCYKRYDQSVDFYKHDRPKWIDDDMIEKLAKIQAEVKYTQIIKIQNNIQNNSDLTSAGSKNECQVNTCQTYEVKSMSAWTSEKKTYRADFGSNGRFCSCTCLFFVKNGFFTSFTDISPKPSFYHLRRIIFPKNA